MIKEMLKKNWIFILFALVGVWCLITMDNKLPMNIVPYPDSQIEISMNDDVLEQTWLSEVKEISEVNFIAIPNHTFDAMLQMEVLNGSNGEILATAQQEIGFEQGKEQRVSFSIPTLKNCQGVQYIFRLSGKSDSSENQLAIPSGTNYMGCTVNKIEQQQGVAFELTFIKSSTISWLFMSFLPFIAFTLFFMVLWSKKWEECVGLSTAVLMLILFVMGLLRGLETGIILIYVLSILAFVFGIVFYNKKNMQLSDLASYGLLIYGIMAVLILINCNDARLARWDEFSHWGLAVKDMYYSNSFVRHVDSAVMVRHYPPGTAIIEYFFCYINGLFSDSAVYVGFQVLALNLLSSGLGICKNRKVGTIIPVFLTLLFVPMIFFYDVYNCLYTDSMLALGVAYILICYYTEEKNRYNFLRIMGGLLILTLTKYTGIVLAGLVCMIMLGDCIYKQFRNKEWSLRESSVYVLFIVWICVLFFGWQFYLSAPMTESIDMAKTKNETNVEIIAEIEVATTKEVAIETVMEESTEVKAEASIESIASATMSSGISFGGILALCTGNSPEYHYEAIKNFLARLFSENEYTIGSISLPYMDITVLLLLMTLLAAEKCIKKEDKKELQTFGVLVFIANIGYCIFQMITYLFTFSEYEALISSSYGRYLGSYLCGVIIAFGIIVIKKMEDWDVQFERTTLLIVTVALIIATPMEFFWVKNEDTNLPDNFVYGYEELNNILQTGAKKGDKVFFVCNDTNGFAELQFKNAVVPMLTDFPAANIYSSLESYEKQRELYEMRESVAPRFVSTEELYYGLYNYQYVVLFHPNEVFKESYGSLFEEPNSIDDGTVYEVYQNNGEMELKFIGKTGIIEFF